ncbi:alpha/beta hydrolase fold domain-containing protein [Gorillibacterium timonense]|uniref:alpha/beta hydrolase fold domain-containing protein n=1 Tax=Gorillibacterium timonense TaxID=1689269 RepID=UPI0009EA3D5C|nr:alpha/beta hydrolase fold domain-containing protein [Gorillibacterium timonense]
MPSVESIAIKKRLLQEGFHAKWQSAESIRAYLESLPAYPALSFKRTGWQEDRYDDPDWGQVKVYRFGEQTDKKGTLVYYHGGAYIEEILPPHFSFAEALVSLTGLPVIVPNYPTVPAATADTLNRLLAGFYDFVHSQTDGPVHLIGDSAGAALALNAAKQGIASSREAATLTLLSPWVDVTTDNPRIEEEGLAELDVFLQPPGLGEVGRLFAGDLGVKHPLASPLFGSLAGLPRTLVLIGTADSLLPDARLLQDKLKREGVDSRYMEFADMMHAWPLFSMPEAEEARRLIRDFVCSAGSVSGAADTVPDSTAKGRHSESGGKP